MNEEKEPLSGPIDARDDFLEIKRLAEEWNRKHGHMGLSIIVASHFGSFLGGVTCKAVAIMASLICSVMQRLEQEGEREAEKLIKLRGGRKN